jgi:hypothetical protein
LWFSKGVTHFYTVKHTAYFGRKEPSLYVKQKGKCKSKVIPLQAYGAQKVLWRLRLPDSVTSALEGGRLSAIRTGHLYPQEYPGTHFKRLSRPRAHGIVGCHGKKYPVTPPGIEPGTFRLVAQCLNHYATPGPSLCVNNRNVTCIKNSIKYILPVSNLSCRCFGLTKPRTLQLKKYLSIVCKRMIFPFKHRFCVCTLKFTLEQATKAQRGCKGIAILFL